MSIIAQNNAFDRNVREYGNLWKKLPAYVVAAGVDTEYVQRPNHPNQMITTQFAFSETDTCVLEHPSLGLGLEPTWSGKTAISAALGVKEVEEQPIEGYLVWEHIQFFAPADVLAGLFTDFELCRWVQRFLIQDARIRVDSGDKKYPQLLQLPIYLETSKGVLRLVLKVIDLGKLGIGGLGKVCAGFGVPHNSKTTMDAYKTNMLVPYKDPELHRLYIKYGVEDAIATWKLRAANMEREKTIYGVHNMVPPDKEIITPGSKQATLFEQYLNQQIGDHKGYEYFTITSHKGVTRAFTLRDIVGKSTVNHFAKRSNNTRQVLALGHGGRAFNERPDIVRGWNIADPDFAGFYVTLQRLMNYPVGIPSTYGVHESNPMRLNLGQFLKKYPLEVLGQLFTIVVTGCLKHSQSLIQSKDVDVLTIADNYDESDPKIAGQVRLYQNEIINGVLTVHHLQVLRNVCTDLEWSEYMKLTVVSAAWFNPADCYTDPEAWAEAIRLHKEKTGNCVTEEVDIYGRTNIKDERSRAWLAIPLDNFLKPYQEQRSEYKKMLRKVAKGCEEYLSLDAKQTGLKDVGNVNFGVQSSPYFPISNIVVANNITGAGRVAQWCAAMALASYLSITDGGQFCLNTVRFWEKNKPGMNTLTLWRSVKLVDRMTAKNLTTAPLLARDVVSRLTTAPLGGEQKEWSVLPSDRINPDKLDDNGQPIKGLYQILTNGEMTMECEEESWDELDRMVEEHVRHFFRPTGKGRRSCEIELLNHLKIAHKDVYVSSAQQSQVNYIMTRADGSTKVKARGHKTKGKPYNNETERSCMVDLLEQLRDDPHNVPFYHPQTISQVIKCNQANKMLKAASDNVLKSNGLLAGDSMLKRAWVRAVSMSMFNYRDSAQADVWMKTEAKLKERSGCGVEQFFMNPDGKTYDYQRCVIETQAAIDEGKLWYTPIRRNAKVEPVLTHPYMPSDPMEEADEDDEEELLLTPDSDD